MKVNHRLGRCTSLSFLIASIDLGFSTQPICMLNLILLEGLEQNTEDSHTLAELVYYQYQTLIHRYMYSIFGDIAEYSVHAYTQHSQAASIILSIIGRFYQE